ncbi:DUF1027 domain-containing protein [Dolosigranulum pigrum]|nr:DUF1027 domain-containing protein [Dolosigranulum pigrum]QTJ55070.1 DUF1027 domain-containing protein [Dolosigranulum pigrum]
MIKWKRIVKEVRKLMIQKKSVDKKTDQLIEEQVNLTETKRLIKKIDSNHLMINGVKYEIVQNYKEALAIEVLENRYTEFFEKYDYIVGDLSREALRLRGFYADHQRKVPVDMRISYLEDYLAEFCNFGCPYFVLQRLAPKKHFKPYNSKDNQQYHKKKAKFKKKPHKSK